MSFVQLQFRRDTAANWTSANPTLAAGELGYETDTHQIKVGDGTTVWTALAYGGIAGPPGSGQLTMNVTASTTVTAVDGNHYALTAGSTVTVNLPVGVVGHSVSITVANGRFDTIVAPNGTEKIMGGAASETMVMDDPNRSAVLRYINATKGWMIV